MKKILFLLVVLVAAHPLYASTKKVLKSQELSDVVTRDIFVNTAIKSGKWAGWKAAQLGALAAGAWVGNKAGYHLFLRKQSYGDSTPNALFLKPFRNFTSIDYFFDLIPNPYYKNYNYYGLFGALGGVASLWVLNNASWIRDQVKPVEQSVSGKLSEQATKIKAYLRTKLA